MRPLSLLRRMLPARAGRFFRRESFEWAPVMRQTFHDAPASLQPSFQQAGHRTSHHFPHRFYCLPKCGPDGLRMATWMCGVKHPDRLWQVVLYATGPIIEDLPEAIFFDADLLWHQQHFSRPGQIASATLVQDGGTFYSMAHQSDLVQRISRNRELKTVVEKRFKGWHHLLLNAIAAFAVQRGARRIRVPASRFMMQHTDRSRNVQPELFERVYDRAVNHLFHATAAGDWWSVDLAANRGAIVSPPIATEHRSGKTVCLCHDIERGLGHWRADSEFAKRAESEAPAALGAMLAMERSAGVRATYNVVGSLMTELRGEIERDGHALGFHSHDHNPANEQLLACRKVDYRIKGYRPPNSRLTPELLDSRLLWHNFEWLASSASSLGFQLPQVADRLVRIPILLDDFPLYRNAETFDGWARRLLDMIRQHDFVAVSTHDCYAAHWLPGYPRLLEEIRALARLRTLDEVAAELYLAAGV